MNPNTFTERFYRDYQALDEKTLDRYKKAKAALRRGRSSKRVREKLVRRCYHFETTEIIDDSVISLEMFEAQKKFIENRYSNAQFHELFAFKENKPPFTTAPIPNE